MHSDERRVSEILVASTQNPVGRGQQKSELLPCSVQSDASKIDQISVDTNAITSNISIIRFYVESLSMESLSWCIAQI